MQLAKRLFMGFGVVAFVAMSFMLAAPKAVHAIVATLVQVANTSANPVPNSDVNNPDKATLLVLGCQGNADGNANFTCDPNSTIPVGQRFAIDRVEADCFTTAGITFGNAHLSLTEGGSPTAHVLPLNSLETGFNTEYVLSMPVRFYADAGSYIGFEAYLSAPSGDTFCNFQADGYLINYP
jgi:hypothetical protein